MFVSNWKVDFAYTHPYATKKRFFRKTCMCKAYYKRSSWARIKLKLLLISHLTINEM